MKKKLQILLLGFSMLISLSLNAQTIIETSFETPTYSVGELNGQNWSMDEDGASHVVSTANYVHSGNQGIQLGSSSEGVELNYEAFDKTTTGISGTVYLDAWVKLVSSSKAEVLQIAAYDLLPNGSGRRSVLFEFNTTNVLRVYNGGSKIEIPSDQYIIGEWTRLSAKIDYSTLSCEIAINGKVFDTELDFRDSYDASAMGRDTDIKEFHALRFNYDNDSKDIAIDDVYIGTNAISDIAFSEPSTARTISITQADNATITISPLKDEYQVGEEVSVFIAVDEHYIFSGWTGSISGSENPKVFTVDVNASIGAIVDVDPSDPPTEYTVEVTQTNGGTVTVLPSAEPYYEGNTLTFEASPNIGYQFSSWNGIEGSTSKENVTISSDLNVSAVFTEMSNEGRSINVSTTSQFEDALDDIQPGDHIILADGTYDGISKSFNTVGGTASAPVIIEAQNQGMAKITGDGYFTLNYCAYITFKGFSFDVETYTLFKLVGCNNVRICYNEFKNTGDGGSKLILIGDGWDNTECVSHHNRIDHNLFDGKSDHGAWLVIDGSHGGTPQVSQYDRIDHNHFRFNQTRITNEKETIRIGMSDLSLSSAYCTVENNLFEECDGDPEIISVKSCDNFVRNNTFLRCLGTVSLRHGDRTEVSGNFFFGQNKTAEFEGSTIGCGGVRVYGKDHKIFNNYFEGLTGSLWDAACTLTCGDALNDGVSNSSDLTKHYVIENLEFTHNTLVNNASDIEIGYRSDWGEAPINCLIANNIIIQDTNPVVTIKTSGKESGVSFADNIIYTTGSGSWGDIAFSAAEASNTDPLLELSACRAPSSSCEALLPTEIYKISSSSPAINATTANTFSYLNEDIEGQPKVGIRDLGADEYNATDEITNGALDASHIGPNAVPFVESNVVSVGPSLFNNDSDVWVYPNPFSESTKINSAGKSNVKIYTVNGHLVDYFEMQNAEIWTAPSKGVYILLMEDEEGKVSRLKIVAQ